MNAPLDSYAEFYDIATDSYDIDAYAHAVTLDNLGMYTPAYRAMVEGDLAVMEAYNDLHATHTDTVGRAAKWLARFERVVYAYPILLTLVGVAVAAL
jgi:hypothetical protein